MGRKLDYDVLDKQIAKAFRNIGQTNREWTLEKYQSFFRFYYQTYKEKTGKDHAILPTAVIEKVLFELPITPGEYDLPDIGCEEMVEIAKDYFRNRTLKCNPLITHFVSGKIRALRFYEQEW